MNILKKWYYRKQFQKHGYANVKNLLSKDVCKLLADSMQIVKKRDHGMDGKDINDPNAYNDTQVPFSFPVYSSDFNDAVLLSVLPIVEHITNKRLYPCYTYSRIMTEGAEMKAHRDRPSCEFSATICIDIKEGSTDYPIYMENKKGKPNKIIQSPGDAIIYNGTELMHWRSKYEGKEQTQLFIHYVDADGLYSDHVFDKRPGLGFPADTRIRD
jgi:hypothetical protein